MSDHDFCRQLVKVAREDAKLAGVSIPKLGRTWSQKIGNTIHHEIYDTTKKVFETTACCGYHARYEYIASLIDQVSKDESEPEPTNEMQIKYPKIEVQLTGTDGNALAIVNTVRRALRKAGVSRDEISAFQKEAMSGDYNNVLTTAMKWVEVS